MEEQLSRLYNDLVNQMNLIIPEGWSEIYYWGEVEKNVSSCSTIFYYKSIHKDIFVPSSDILNCGISIDAYRETLGKLRDILLEIYSCFKETEQKLWERISLYVDSKGKFKLDFKYDIMRENDGGYLTREIIWAYETFEYIPKDEYLKKVLDKYLESKN